MVCSDDFSGVCSDCFEVTGGCSGGSSSLMLLGGGVLVGVAWGLGMAKGGGQGVSLGFGEGD